MLKLLLPFFMILVTKICSAQVITADGIDEFTFERIKRSSFVEMNRDNDFTAHACINQIDSTKYFTLKFMLFPQPFTIDTGMRIMFKLQSGEVVTLKTEETFYSCVPCGHEEGLAGSIGEGILARYRISNEDVLKLSTNRVTKVRVYTSKGYVQSEIEAESAKMLYKTFELFKSNN